MGALPAVADKLARDLDNVTKTIEKIEPGLPGLKEGAADLVENFKSEFGHVLDPTARRELVNLLERLKDKAIRSQVSHAAFADLAALRKRAKTPPGFETPVTAISTCGRSFSPVSYWQSRRVGITTAWCLSPMT